MCNLAREERQRYNILHTKLASCPFIKIANGFNPLNKAKSGRGFQDSAKHIRLLASSDQCLKLNLTQTQAMFRVGETDIDGL